MSPTFGWGDIIILDYQYDNITDNMEEFKILNIYERIYLKKAKFMFKISNSLTPDYINEMFHLRPLNNTLQSLRTSAAINYVLPRPNKELFKQSLIKTMFSEENYVPPTV